MSKASSSLVPKTNHPRQLEVYAKRRIVEAFGSDKTAEEMLAAFQDMEASLDVADLGLASLKVGIQLHKDGKDPEKALCFAQKALKALDEHGKPSLPVAMALHLMGCVNIRLERFDDSLECLNRANSLLRKLEEDGVENIMPGMHAVQVELANVKTAMGRRDEGLENLKKALKIKEMTSEKDSKEMGMAYRDLASGYFLVSNLKEALPFGLKALEIHKEDLGHNSVEVAHDRRILGAIYAGLGDHNKALKQFQLSRKVFKQCGLTSEFLSTEMDAAKMQISLGKFDEAMNTLKGIVEQTNNEKDSEDQADVATVYEAMNEIETAVSLLKRALALIEKEPQEKHAEGTVCARIGWMLLSRGEVPQAIPYMESATERLKASFASKHFVAGHNYNNLGVAYLESERPQPVAQMFAIAKDILDVACGPHHPDSIVACQNLSMAYSTMGSYTLAIESQQQVIDALKIHGPSALDELITALGILEGLKRKARGKSIPVVDLERHDRNQTIQQILKARVINHGISEDLKDETLNVAEGSHAMPGLEKERECAKDANGSCKLYTISYAYPMEDFHYWRDAPTDPGHPLEECIPEKPTTYR
ncbi:hypothetical protein PTKIN_Ptkin15bG0118600 [Pterospermum kingtungense]